jgi:hypothetical protein
MFDAIAARAVASRYNPLFAGLLSVAIVFERQCGQRHASNVCAGAAKGRRLCAARAGLGEAAELLGTFGKPSGATAGLDSSVHRRA